MTALDVGVQIAMVTAVPATIASAAALISAWRLRKPVNEINAAVNQRPEGEPKLLQICLDTNDRLGRVEKKIDRHLEWHAEHPDITVDEVVEILEEVVG